MPKVNIKPHATVLNSIQSTIARGLLHTLESKNAKMKASGSSPSSALDFHSASASKGAALQPDHFQPLQEEAAEQIPSLQCSSQKWAFSLPTLPATSFPGLVPPQEVAEFSMLPTHKR